MGSYVRVYKMADGMLIGFYAEQGGYIMFGKIPGTGKIVFAYANPEDDYRFELISATRSAKSIYGRQDAIVIKDNRTGMIKSELVEFLGVAYEVGKNRFMMGRSTKPAKKEN